jgi:cytoskeleton protein RodZ
VDMPRCPRCSSSLVSRVRETVSTASVLDLRDDAAPVREQWLCSACSHSWSPTSTRADAHPAVTVGASRSPREAFDFRRRTTPDLASEPADETPPSYGAELAAARAAKGLSIADVAVATSIWERYLVALERDADPSAFPAPAYARYFLREYADHLGVDSGELLERFDLRYPLSDDPDEAPLPFERPTRRRFIRGSLVGLSVLALIAMAIMASARPQPAIDDHPSVAPPVHGSSAPVDDHVAADAPHHDANRNGLRAVFMFTDPCWVALERDGEPLVARTFDAGRRLVVTADRDIAVVLGNAGAVDLTINGSAMETGEPGAVAELTYRWRAGDVRVIEGPRPEVPKTSPSSN